MASSTAKIGAVSRRVAKMAQYMPMSRFMVIREIKLRYTQSSLGLAWLIIDPLIMVLTLSTIFTIVGRKSPEGIPFPVFFYSALLPWQFFSAMLNSGSKCFVADKALIAKIPFPKEIVVIKKLAIAFVDFVFANICLAFVLIWYGFYPNLNYLWIPFLLVLVSILGLGTMFLLGTLNVFIRDVGILAKSASSILFWFTPIIFAFPFEGHSKYLYYINPMAGIVSAYREIILFGTFPDFELLAPSCIWVIAIFAVGYGIFLKFEDDFVDVI